MKAFDTIAAIATPPGEGGIGIVRISGPGAVEASLRVFKGADIEALGKGLKERVLYYGRITGAEGVPVESSLDDGFLVWFKGPRSFTGEDVVELQCHGGPLVLKRVLEEVLKSGARLAEPGEFTKRAFLNGRLDLFQAEAVIDVIRASTAGALLSARGRLDGLLSRKVREIKEVVLDLVTRIEAELDFPEDEVEITPLDHISGRIEKAVGLIKALLSTYDEGVVLREGIRALILGRPNVGKSSLLNLLLKEERAIVTPIPGTTRDIIEETIDLRGVPVRLMDTAGLRDTADHAEAIGVAKARERIASSGLIIYVLDSTAATFDEDILLLKDTEGKRVVIAANKADLADRKTRDLIRKKFEGLKIVFTSATDNTGIEELKDAVYEEALGRTPGKAAEPGYGELIVNLRHKDALGKSLASLGKARQALKENLPGEILAADLRAALNSIGEITGETTTEDILERIFSSFCIGK